VPLKLHSCSSTYSYTVPSLFIRRENELDFWSVLFKDTVYRSQHECTASVPTNGDGSQPLRELSLSTGRRFRVVPLFCDTLEIKFTRNSAYFVPGARARNRNEWVLCERLALEARSTIFRVRDARPAKYATAMCECVHCLSRHFPVIFSCEVIVGKIKSDADLRSGTKMSGNINHCVRKRSTPPSY
jgi:hypothetical protein